MAHKPSMFFPIAAALAACLAMLPAVAGAQAATVTTLTASPAVLAAATTETFTATIAPAATTTGTYTITGAVSFYDHGSVLLGMAAVASNTATLSGIKLADTASHSITAVYSGDANWLTSTSSPVLLAATILPDYVVLTSNYTTVLPGQALVLTVTVTPSMTPASGAEQNPAGNVIFYNGTTAIGTAALAPQASGDASTATLTTLTLPGGMDSLSAVYQGDSYFSAGNSNVLTLAIQDFTIAPDPSNPPTNVNIVQGSAGSASFDIGGLGGFNGLIQVVCAVPSQDDMTCTASPQQVTPPAVVTFAIQTFATGGSASAANGSQGRPSPWRTAAGGAALTLLGFLVLPMWRSRKLFSHGEGIAANRSARRFLILALLLVALGGAGTGCTDTTRLGSYGTPLGVATLKITASAYVDNTVVSHSVYLTVNVTAPASSQ